MSNFQTIMGNFLTRNEKSFIEQILCFKKIGLAFCFILFFSVNGYSQKYRVVEKGQVPENLEAMNKKTSKSVKVNELFEKIDGTYQIQITAPSYKIMRSAALYNKIVESRKPNEDVYVVLDDKSKIYIPSEASIKKKDFNKLSNSIYITK